MRCYPLFRGYHELSRLFDVYFSFCLSFDVADMSRLTVNGIVAIFILLIEVVMAVDNHGVNFTYPTEGLTLYRLDTVNVSWTSNFSTPLLYTFCKNKTGDNPITGMFYFISLYSSFLVSLTLPSQKSTQASNPTTPVSSSFSTSTALQAATSISAQMPRQASAPTLRPSNIS